MSMITDITPSLVDVRGAARILSISERAVWRLLKNGQFPQPVHIGRTTRWRTTDLEDFISRLAEESK